MTTEERQALVLRYCRLAHGLACRYARSRPRDADDLFGAARLALVRAAAIWEPGSGHFPAYARVTVNLALLAELKRLNLAGFSGLASGRAPKWRPAFEPPGETVDPGDPDPPEAAARAASAVLARLAPREAEALCLTYGDGLSEADAAARMGITPRAVHKVKTAALARARSAGPHD